MTQEHATKHKKKRRKGRRRHIPQRTCVGCRTVHPKREMLRVVRTPTGAIEIDSSGKQAGRGAYLCRQQGCWETALKRRSLSRALKTTLDDATQATLIAHARTLPQSLGVATPPRAQEQLENLDGG
ncbi:MAG: YlxR family protein [Anaerolineae bacterium]